MSDAPNLFTERFEKVERKKGIPRIAVDRNPDTFRFIHRYLQGYDMDKTVQQLSEVDKEYIRQDARFYRLRGLCDTIDEQWCKREADESCYMPLVDYDTSDDESEILDDFTDFSDCL